jgi:hypothetical protein
MHSFARPFFDLTAPLILLEKVGMTAPYTASHCRMDLVKPMIIFGGVLLLSAAFCGAVDTIESSPFVEEVKVVRAEGAAGGHEADLLVACQHARQSALKDVRCRALERSRFSQASF